MEGSNDFRESVIIQLFSYDAKVVAIPLISDDGDGVEEYVRDALLVASVLWCTSLGNKPGFVNLAKTPRWDIDMKVRASHLNVLLIGVGSFGVLTFLCLQPLLNISALTFDSPSKNSRTKF